MATPTALSWRSYACIHSAIFTWYVLTLRANCSLDISKRHPGALSYGGRWKYLTFINLVLQTVFFGLCLLIDLVHLALPSKSVRGGIPSFLVKLRDAFFTVLAFPVGTFVFASFWILYSYNRELVYPKYLDDIIPVWLNHALHTFILPLALAQLYIQPHKYPSRSKAILGLACFASAYLAWVFWVHHVTGVWVYPIMAHLSALGLVLFLVGAALTMAPLFLLGEKLNRMIWRSTGPQKKKQK